MNYSFDGLYGDYKTDCRRSRKRLDIEEANLEQEIQKLSERLTEVRDGSLYMDDTIKFLELLKNGFSGEPSGEWWVRYVGEISQEGGIKPTNEPKIFANIEGINTPLPVFMSYRRGLETEQHRRAYVVTPKEFILILVASQYQEDGYTGKPEMSPGIELVEMSE